MEPKIEETELEEQVEAAPAEEWIDLLGSGSIMKKIIKEGTPDTKPQRLQKCYVNYKCTLEDDTLVDEVQNMELFLGDCDVIQGLDVAIALMNEHERCLLKIAPRLAYGDKGLPDKVPGSSTVVYDIELVDVRLEVFPEELTISERKILGNKKRERGNWWYGRGENTLAVQCYRRALNYLDEVENATDTTDADLQELLEARVSVSNNMAAAQIKLEHYDGALQSLQTVLRCKPDNVKALFRKAKVHRAKNDVQAALRSLQKAREAAPDDQDVQRELAAVSALIQRQRGVERDLAKRMFSGGNKKTNNERPGRAKKIGFWATVGATLALGVGVFAYKFVRI